jgi:hypothetical protein
LEDSGDELRLGCKQEQVTTAVSLSDPKVFFEEVARPSFDDFMNNQSSFKTAIHAATALFHLHEWVWEFKRTEIEAKYSQAFASRGVFWKLIEAKVPQARFVRDLANASKHVRLTIKPSTSMTHIANTTIQTVRFGEGDYGVGRDSAPSVVMKDGPNDISLDDCLQDLFHFWSSLLADLYPR